VTDEGTDGQINRWTAPIHKPLACYRERWLSKC